MPTGAALPMLALEKRVQQMRPEWTRSTLTYAEQQAMMQNAGCLTSISDEDWATMKKYLNDARLAEGVPKWQPRSRFKFIEGAADVLNYALDWDKKNNAAGPMRPQSGSIRR